MGDFKKYRNKQTGEEVEAAKVNTGVKFPHLIHQWMIIGDKIETTDLTDEQFNDKFEETK